MGHINNNGNDQQPQCQSKFRTLLPRHVEKTRQMRVWFWTTYKKIGHPSILNRHISQSYCCLNTSMYNTIYYSSVRKSSEAADVVCRVDRFVGALFVEDGRRDLGLTARVLSRRWVSFHFVLVLTDDVTQVLDERRLILQTKGTLTV